MYVDWDQLLSDVDKGITKKELLNHYTQIFQQVTKMNFEPYKFFQEFMSKVEPWIKKQKPVVELPGVWQVIPEYLTLNDLISLKCVNKIFNNGIKTDIILKIKILNNILAYFNRTFLRNSAQRELFTFGTSEFNKSYTEYYKSKGIDKYQAFTMKCVLIYLLED